MGRTKRRARLLSAILPPPPTLSRMVRDDRPYRSLGRYQQRRNAVSKVWTHHMVSSLDDSTKRTVRDDEAQEGEGEADV